MLTNMASTNLVSLLDYYLYNTPLIAISCSGDSIPLITHSQNNYMACVWLRGNDVTSYMKQNLFTKCRAPLNLGHCINYGVENYKTIQFKKIYVSLFNMVSFLWYKHLFTNRFENLSRKFDRQALLKAVNIFLAIRRYQWFVCSISQTGQENSSFKISTRLLHANFAEDIWSSRQRSQNVFTHVGTGQ